MTGNRIVVFGVFGAWLGRAALAHRVVGRGFLYDRDGRPLEGRAYFAYETP